MRLVDNGDAMERSGSSEWPAAGSTMTVAARHDGVVGVVEVAGAVDHLTEGELRDVLLEALSEQPPVLVMDLSAVRFFGSIGLAILVEAQQQAGQQTAIRLVVTTPVTRLPLEVTGLSNAFALYDSLREAVNRPSGRP